MKTKNFQRKLVLNKKTVVNLNNNEMGVVYGGCDLSYLSCSTLPAKCTCTELCTEFDPCYPVFRTASQCPETWKCPITI
jgi:hypothetical protein